MEQRRGEITRELQEFARERGFGLQSTPSGIIEFPLSEGRPIPPEELQQLPSERRQELERVGREIHDETVNTAAVRQLEREMQDRGRQLDRQIALYAIDPLVQELQQRYSDQPEVIAQVDRIREDIPEHLPDFQTSQSGDGQHQQAPMAMQQAVQREEHLDRYRVNVLVDNGEEEGAPIVVERNPTYYNLVGRVEYRSAMGMMVTDFGRSHCLVRPCQPREHRVRSLPSRDRDDAASVLSRPWEVLPVESRRVVCCR